MLTLDDRAVLQPPIPIITREEARMLGVRITRAAHVRLRRGVYAPLAAYTTLKPWQKYAVRVQAFIRAHPGIPLCLESASVLLGLPLFGQPKDIHVFDPDLKTSQRFDDICVHTSVDPRELVEVAGVPVTSLLDTVVDLGRVMTPARALAVADAAISPAQGGSVQIRDVRRKVAQQQNGRGRVQLRWICERADERVESPAESVSRAVIEWSGFEEPDLQHEFGYEGCSDRVDFLFPSTQTIGEADGWGKYELEDPDAAADHLREEKRREDRLRRHGHPFARWDLGDAWKVAPLVRALHHAGVPLRHPSQPAMLATLAWNARDLLPTRETSVPAPDSPQQAKSRAGRQVSAE